MEFGEPWNVCPNKARQLKREPQRRPAETHCTAKEHSTVDRHQQAAGKAACMHACIGLDWGSSIA